MNNPYTGSGTSVPINVINVCAYPELTEPVLGPFCESEPASTNLDLLVSELNGFPGMVDVEVNGAASNTFDPAMLGPGSHTILWNFTGSGTGSGSGGSVGMPANPGCNTSYSLAVDVFDDPELVVSSCFCDYDPNIMGLGSQVSISVNGSTGPFTLSTSFGTLSTGSIMSGEMAILYLGDMGGAFTIDITDSNGCIDSYSSSCGDCNNSISITDPCVCNNDQSFNGAGDGTFGEVIEIIGPAGLSLLVGAGSTGISGYPVGSAIPEVNPGVYSLSFDHQDLVGYLLNVEVDAGGNVLPLLDAMGNQISISNQCQYPVITDPDVDMTELCFNGDPIAFTGDEVMEINGFDGFVQVYVGGITTGDLITEFDPSLYENGIYELTFLFSGDNVNNVWDGVTPAFPGCQTSTSITVGIGGGGTLACNDNVNVSVDANCEVDFTWYSLIEDDNVPPLFETQFTDIAGNIVSEDELENYIGQSLTYSIIDICNGNSCWGTLNIEDKSIPSLECDCPVGGETGIGDYSEDCTLSCYELPIFKEKYWDRLRDNLITEDFDDFIDDYVNSVCDDVTSDQISFYDVYIDLRLRRYTYLQRTWSVSYDKGYRTLQGSVSCTFEYLFQTTVGLETADTARIDPLLQVSL